MNNSCPKCGSKLPYSLHFHLVRKYCPHCHSMLVYKRKLRIFLAISVVILSLLAKGNFYLYPFILVLTFIFQPIVSVFVGYDVNAEFGEKYLYSYSKGVSAIYLLYVIGLVFAGGYFIAFNIGLTDNYRLIFLAFINLIVFYIVQIIIFILVKFDLFVKILSNLNYYIGYIFTWILLSMIVFNGFDMIFQAAMKPYLKWFFIIFGLLSIVLTTTQYLINKNIQIEK